MTYYISASTKGEFDAIVAKVTARLKEEGFGVLTEIDVANTLKQKLGVEMKQYRILGACNPSFAHKALSLEDKLGVMLPCNVIVQEKPDGRVDVSAIDPRVAMTNVGNPALSEIAKDVAERLARVVGGI
jgi:uncharacterized protein (DUF302 family)